jgi:hypothetical protein
MLGASDTQAGWALVFAKIQSYGRRRDDSTGVSEPVQCRALVCGGSPTGLPLWGVGGMSNEEGRLP